jgi:hypothetical protein
MSLRVTYTGALDAKLAEAKLEGRKLVIDENNEPNPVSGLADALQVAASQGKKEFTYNVSAGYQSEDLRLLGPLWEAFKTGVIQGLSEQDILVSEADVVLNTGDQMATSVDIVFKF